jgi:hypothetical protein
VTSTVIRNIHERGHEPLTIQAFGQEKGHGSNDCMNDSTWHNDIPDRSGVNRPTSRLKDMTPNGLDVPGGERPGYIVGDGLWRIGGCWRA